MTNSIVQPNAYPWVDSSRLSPAIDQSSLWAFVISEKSIGDSYLTGRRTLKKLIKRHKATLTVVAIENDDSFGAGLANLMRTVGGRHAFFKHFQEETTVKTPRQFLAQRVFAYAQSLFDYSLTLDFCELRSDERYYLSIDLFKGWISESPPVSENLEPFATMLCSFAILQPEIRTELYFAAINAVQEIRTYLDFAKPTPQYATEKRLKVTLPERIVPPEQSKTMSTSPKEDVRATLSKFVAFEFEASALSVVEARAIAQSLSAMHGKISSEIDRYESLRHSAIASFNTILQDFNITSFVSGEVLVPPNPEVTIEESCKSITELETRIQGLRRSASTLREMCSRLDVAYQLGALESSDIASYTLALDKKIDDLRSAIDALAKRDAEVVSILQMVADTKVLDITGLFSSFGDHELASLIGCVVGKKASASTTDVRLERIHGNHRLVGLLLGYRCLHDSRAGLEQVDFVIRQLGGDRLKQYDVLAYLDQTQLQQLVQTMPEYRDMVFEFVLAAAILKQDFDLLLWLRPYLAFSSSSLHLSVGHELISTLVLAIEDSSATEVLNATKRRTSAPLSSGATTRSLLDLIDQPAPAGGGLFHVLRECARNAFLLPLRNDLSRQQRNLAVHSWRSFGSIEEMVEQTVAKIPSRDQRHVETRHREKVSSYLRTFERELVSNTDESGDSREFPQVVEKMRSLNESRSLDPFSYRIRELFSADTSDTGVQWPPVDFGLRVYQGVVGAGLLDSVGPAMPNSWVAKCNGEVRLEHLIADEFSTIARDSIQRVDDDTINLLCSHGEYKAAHAASVLLPELDDAFKRIVEQKINELSPEVIAESRQLAKSDEDLQFLLQLLDDAIAEYDFSEASEAIPVIENRMQKLKLLGNPKHRRMVALLEQLGLSIPTDVSLLESMVKEAKEQAKERRFHIEVLESALTKIPASLQTMFEELVLEIDQPKSWPESEERSAAIADWVDYFTDFILKKSQARRQQFATKLASWFVYELTRTLSQPNAANLQEFNRLKQGRERDFWEEDDILRCIQPVLDSFPTKPEQSVPPTVPDIGAISLVIVEPKEKIDRSGLPTVLEQFRNTVDEIRREQEVETNRECCSDGELKRLCSASKWNEVSRNVRHHREFSDLPTSHLAETECLLLIAEASRHQPDDKNLESLLSQACIAACNLFIRQQDYYLSDQSLQDRAVDFLIGLCRSSCLAQGQRREKAVLLVEHLGNSPKGDNSSLEIVELLRKARFLSSAENLQLRGDLFLASCIWEEFTGAVRAANYRADLLAFLYKCDQIDLLRGIAKKYAPSLSEPIMQCLEAFNQGVSNPDALDEAVQLAAIVHEQSSKEKIAPWTKLISALNSRRKVGGDNEPLKMVDESVVATDRFLVVNASLLPSRNDWPLSLTIRVLDEGEQEIYSQDLLHGKALVRPRPVCIRVPIERDMSKKPITRLLYEVSGSSSQVDNILVRGSWTWKEEKPVEQFSQSELRRYWPCADGKDVKIREQHHGRFDVLEKIDSALAGDDGYQRSLLIVGQRRIGKTSLLNQVLNSHPPRKGACCSVFANVSGLDSSRASLRHALYDKIVEQLQNAPGAKNEKVLSVFTREGRDIRRVLRDIDPSQSIAGALEGIAKVLSRVSDGENDRIAFCLDEFQSVFAWKNVEEIKALMWDLRQIVQSSKSVSLLMAGSGLTRRLTDSYDEALFGSIDTIDLHPFNIDTEFDAVLDTLLPAPIREIFQEEASNSNLARVAHELTGGHPWYLAILGSSMGAIFGKTFVTPSMLSVVVEQLVNGTVNACGIQFRASNFYGHLFESLNVLGPRQTAIAQLVLLTIARNTTTDWRDCQESRVKQNELLASQTEQTEISDALKALEREQVIEKDRKNANRVYRLRVPIVAEALRHDADEIEDDALNMLKT